MGTLTLFWIEGKKLAREERERCGVEGGQEKTREEGRDKEGRREGARQRDGVG